MAVAGLYIALMVLSGLIAAYDFSFYRIPNVLVLMVVLIYFATAPFIFNMASIISSSAIFAATLGVGFTLFAFGIFGGGDAKYLAATSLWAGTEHIILFVVLVTLAGGLLALAYLFIQPQIASLSTQLWNRMLLLEKRFNLLQCVWAFSGNGPDTHQREAIKDNQLPYGIAISIGMIVVFYLKLTS